MICPTTEIDGSIPEAPISVLWLTPDKPADISVGRRRIAEHLEAAAFEVTLRGTVPRTVVRSLRERGRYDVIVGTTRAGALAGVVVSLAHSVPLVVDHVDPIHQFYEQNSRPVGALVDALECGAFRVADHVVYVYDEERSRVRTRAKACTQTDLGVDFDRFADPSPDVLSAARDCIGDVSGKVAIYLGGLEPIYSIEELLESVRYLRNWTLLVIGAGSLEEAVASAARNDDAIRYLGTVPHETVPGYLHLADVGLALVDDPHTLKALEYAAAGLPFVGLEGRAQARFGDLIEYAPPEPPAIAAAIERAANTTSKDELQTFARRFNWHEIADDYGRVITTVK